MSKQKKTKNVANATKPQLCYDGFTLSADELLMREVRLEVECAKRLEDLNEWELCAIPLIKYVCSAPFVEYVVQNLQTIRDDCTAKNDERSYGLLVTAVSGWRDRIYAIGEALYKELFGNIPLHNFWKSLSVADCCKIINAYGEAVKCAVKTAQ